MITDDEKLVRAITFEYEMLEQSYKLFSYLLLKNTDRHDDEIKVYLYSSYGKIIQHLYEYMKASVARDISKTKSGDREFVKQYIVTHLKKMAIGKPEKALPVSRFEDFAEDLRMYRNKVSSHVLKERFDDYPLDVFYSKHHAFVVWLVSEAKCNWKSNYSGLANHDSIQKFSEILTFGQRQPVDIDS